MYNATFIQHIKITAHNTSLLEKPHHWRLHSKGVVLTVGCTYSLSVVLTLTTGMPPSKVKASVILPSNHFLIASPFLLQLSILGIPLICLPFVSLLYGWQILWQPSLPKLLGYSDNLIPLSSTRFITISILTYFTHSIQSFQEKRVQSQSFKIILTVVDMSQQVIVCDCLNLCKDCAQLKFC